MKVLKRTIVGLILLTVVYSINLYPQELTSESKINMVNKISTMLAEQYVFPDVGEACGEHIKRKLEEGAFDNIINREKFAERLTEELQSISKDKHMRVRKGNQPAPQVEQNPFYMAYTFQVQSRQENSGFVKAEYLEEGIGYLDLRFFASSPAAERVAEASMEFLSNSDAVIIDLRKNTGGSPEMIRFISSYFFDEPTHLNSLYYRVGDRTEEFWTRKVENSTLIDVPIFVLTSSSTFSGGEEFANNLKVLKRAELIGETTGGGANPGGTFSIDDQMVIFIPTGRAINPITKTNWEGTGVEPDIKVPADDAFDIAYERAKTAAEKYRAGKAEYVKDLLEKMSGKLKEAEELISTDELKAEQLVNEALEFGLKSNVANEAAINMAGYNYLFSGKTKMAVAVLKFNVKEFPESYNTYDSLGEAYMNLKKNDLAVTNYKKSLELNPANKNAEEMIKKMTTQQ